MTIFLYWKFIYLFIYLFFFFSAVKKGSLEIFNEVLEKFGSKFQAENTYTLIIRLRHNVIKTGVRMINVSYSRISLKDIGQKLLLDSYEDAEYIVAKVSLRCLVLFFSLFCYLGFTHLYVMLFHVSFFFVVKLLLNMQNL